MDNKNAVVNALFDSGSLYTIIREDKLPSKKSFYPISETLGTAVKEGKVQINAAGLLIMEHEDKKIRTEVLVSPNLKQEMIIGAGTMQSWHINIQNRKGKTKVIFGLDMRDPELTEVDFIETIHLYSLTINS